MSQTVITVRDLSCRFKNKVALDGVTLEMQSGRVFGLVGENGAGKTTLMKHLLGSLTPQSGEVRVLDHEPVRDPVSVLARVGYMSEDRDLPRWMRLNELLRYTAAFFPDWDQDYAESMLAQFDLDPASRVRTLSRGELAKASLLLALAHRPPLLLLDEPSSGLDAVSRRDILAVVVRSVAEEGRTVVFSSHLLDEVERVADDVAMIHHGKVVLNDTMDNIRANHQRRVVRFSENMDAFPECACALHAEGEGRDWSVTTHGEAAETRASLEALGAKIVEETSPTLEALFVARVAGARGKQKAA